MLTNAMQVCALRSVKWALMAKIIPKNLSQAISVNVIMLDVSDNTEKDETKNQICAFIYIFTIKSN